METELRELMQAMAGDPPHHINAEAIRHQAARRRRTFAVISAVAAVAVIATVIPPLAGAYSGPIQGRNGSPGHSYLTQLPDGHGSVYHDAAGWMIDIPAGWHVVIFRSSKGGATAAGAQISNVALPAPTIMPGFPIQSSGEILPARGVSLVIATDNDPKLCRPGLHRSRNGVVSSCQRSYASLPISFRELIWGSSPGDSPVMGSLWLKAGGKALSLTAKFGASAYSDRMINPVSKMMASMKIANSDAKLQRSASSRMPLVNGLTLTAAEALISSAVTSPRFTVQQVEDALPAGLVTAQMPVNGSRLAPGSPILLTVSNGDRVPACTAPAQPASGTVTVTTQAGPPYFTRNCYYARSGQRLTIKLTNRVFTLRGEQPVTDRLILSPIRKPAFWPVRRHPGIVAGSTRHAIFVSPGVTAPSTGVFTIRPLAPGTYVMQLMRYGMESTVRLIVR